MIKTFNYIFLLVFSLSGLSLKADDHGIPNLIGTWVGINKTVSEQRGFRSWEKKVEIIEQNVKAGWQGGVLYLEVHTMHDYGLEENEKKKPNIRFLPEAARIIQEVAGAYIAKINWIKVTEIVRTANGLPEAVLTRY